MVLERHVFLARVVQYGSCFTWNCEATWNRDSGEKNKEGKWKHLSLRFWYFGHPFHNNTGLKSETQSFFIIHWSVFPLRKSLPRQCFVTAGGERTTVLLPALTEQFKCHLCCYSCTIYIIICWVRRMPADCRNVVAWTWWWWTDRHRKSPVLNAHLSSNTLQLGRNACQAKQDALSRERFASEEGGICVLALKTGTLKITQKSLAATYMAFPFFNVVRLLHFSDHAAILRTCFTAIGMWMESVNSLHKHSEQTGLSERITRARQTLELWVDSR